MRKNMDFETKLAVIEAGQACENAHAWHAILHAAGHTSEEIATFGEEDVYNQHDAEGFINLFGLPVKVKALLDQKKLK